MSRLRSATTGKLLKTLNGSRGSGQSTQTAPRCPLAFRLCRGTDLLQLMLFSSTHDSQAIQEKLIQELCHKSNLCPSYWFTSGAVICFAKEVWAHYSSTWQEPILLILHQQSRFVEFKHVTQKREHATARFVKQSLTCKLPSTISALFPFVSRWEKSR